MMILKLIVGLIVIVFILFILSKIFPLVEICGDSMTPTYDNGDILITTRVFKVKNTKVGDIFVFKTPYRSDGRLVVKRVTKLHYEDSVPTLLYFEGDNAEVSYDSRHYGYVNPKLLYAKIITNKVVKKARKSND